MTKDIEYLRNMAQTMSENDHLDILGSRTKRLFEIAERLEAYEHQIHNLGAKLQLAVFTLDSEAIAHREQGHLATAQRLEEVVKTILAPDTPPTNGS